MTYSQICRLDTINSIDSKKLAKIVNSMKKKGYVGCPILVCNATLVTGSHRLEALRVLEEDGYDVYGWEVAEDVTDIVEDAFARFQQEYGYERDMDYSSIGWIFEGTWVESFKDSILEW